MKGINVLKKVKKSENALKNRRRGPVEKTIFVIAFIVFALYAFLMMYAFFWIVVSSFKSNQEYFASAVKLPSVWKIQNYFEAYRVLEYNGTNFIGMTFNSIWYSLGSSVLHILSCSVTGYVFAKYEFKGKKAIMSVAIFAMVVPIIGGLPAQYKMMYDLNLVNSPLVLISALGGFGMHFIILRSFFKNLSWSYAEAAFMDGGTNVGVFFKIMLPLAKGPVLALGIRVFIQYWNDYYTPLLFLDQLPPLATGLFYYRKELDFVSNEPVYFAGIVMSSIPVLILFAFFSEKIMENVVAGGLKG